MRKQKSINNKGFSLVELIIVIAIMAILIGVLAPNLLRYVERSNVSADLQLAETLRTVITTTMMDPNVLPLDIQAYTGAHTAGTPANITAGMQGTFLAEVQNSLGTNLADITALQTDLDGRVRSRTAAGFAIQSEVTAQNQLIVTILGTDRMAAGNEAIAGYEITAE